jgi:nucleoside-triphosphatase
MNVLLTGKPGVGKTTIIKKVVEGRENAGGFYTEEIRDRYRKGFKIMTLDGEEGILAHVDIKNRRTVGKYGVNTPDIDAIAVKSVEESLDREIIVIDEIGKMELYSEKFRDILGKALDTGNVLGTIMGKIIISQKKLKIETM